MTSLAAITAVTGDSLSLSFDVNNGGSIDRAEFHWANPNGLDLGKAFDKLDLDNDGFVNVRRQQEEQRH